MARPAGVRNQDYKAKRKALVEAAAEYVLREDVILPSFRQMAIATGASEPTLKHYFKSRAGLIIAIIEHLNHMAGPTRAYLRRSFDSIEDALQDYRALALRISEDAAFVRGHIFGIRESLLDSEVFEAYIRYLVEPGAAAMAERIVKSPGGPVNYGSARIAAAQIFANVLFIACRKHLLGKKDPGASDLGHNYQLMTNWLLYGMIHDPEGERSQDGENQEISGQH